MKIYSIPRSLIFISVLITLVGSFTVPAQDPGRGRVIATPTPTPKPTPAVTVSPTPTPTPIPVQTLPELQSKIRFRLARPELRRGQIGIKIVSLNTGKVVFEENAEKYFMPASNMKNFTVAAGLEKLTPDFKFVTSVYVAAPPDASGTVKGSLRVYGRGDVSISTAFSDGNYYRGLDDLADKVAAAGVKRVEGDLVADESYFSGGAIPGSWEWDDLQWYYGAEISALPLNDNALDLSVLPGPVGYQCSVRLLPVNPVMRVINQCTTTGTGARRDMRITKKLGQNILEITGSLPAGDGGFKGYITISHPAELFAALLKQRLEQKGVIVTGQARTVSKKDPGATELQIEITKHESPPLSLIAAKTMKPSQNMYTETILWTLGEEMAKNGLNGQPAAGPLSTTRPDSSSLGLAEVKKFLTGIGMPADAVVQYDGSGLSRHNLITPSAVVHLYTYMARQSRFANAWRDSLTIAGVDGTLRNRFAGTRAAGNVRGKTGTIDQVSALSGYVTTVAGEQLVFSFVVNGIPEGRMRTSLIDEIVVNLANFNGKIDQ